MKQRIFAAGFVCLLFALGIASLNLSGCKKADPPLPPGNTTSALQRELTNITPDEFDGVLVQLSKGFVDLLQSDEFVTELYGLFGPCGEIPITQDFLNRPVPGMENTTIQDAMNDAIAKYSSPAPDGRHDYVSELLGKFMVDGIPYAPSLHIPNFEQAKLSEALPLAAPGVGHNVEGIEGEAVKAWSSNGTTLSQTNVSRTMAETTTPVLIVTNMGIDMINNPCGGYGGGGAGGGGTSGGSGGSSESDYRTGLAIVDESDDAMRINAVKIRLFNRYDNWNTSELHYRLSLAEDRFNPNSNVVHDLANRPGGMKLLNVDKDDILNANELAIDLEMFDWRPQFQYLYVTFFEWDWYPGTKKLIYPTVTGIHIQHEFRAKYSNETYYTRRVGDIGPNNINIESTNLFGGVGEKRGLCNNCYTFSCYSPSVQNCGDDYIELERKH